MPADVSGPGAYSKRPDAGGQPIRDLPDPKYGEATQFKDTQKAAPLAEAAAMPTGPAPSELAQMGAQRPMPGLFDQGDPTIPVTAGAPIGAGPNALTGGAFTPPPRRISEQLAEYAGGDGGEAIAWLANELAGMGQ